VDFAGERSEKMCEWRSRDPTYRCRVPAEPGSKYCIFHEPGEKEFEEFKRRFYHQIDEEGPEDQRNHRYNFTGYVFPDVDIWASDDVVTSNAIVLPRKIDGHIVFLEAKVAKSVYFAQAEIERDALFFYAEIKGDVSFWRAKIRGHTDFSCTKIGGDVVFWEADLGGSADFDEAEIAGGVNFGGATIQRVALFTDARIDGYVVLR